MSRAGQQLSHYRLSDKIGQGGMGEVWRATDLRLDREVAVKFLPEVVTHDPERLERFSREAKFLASLNHPGIATIYDVDEDQGLRFLVMELVPGQDLAEQLESGPLGVSEALEVALQIARAIEAAHGQGVVHRDLKPANVKRTPDGQIKVLDFGLAKMMGSDSTSASTSPSVSMSPTMTSAGTVAGVILGTAAYMSPEQARGRPIDKRTDIWSFGVLLYELLTGDNPFRGDTVADSVGAIMHRDPDLDSLPPGTSPAVKRVLRRCLTRERAHRLHDIADVRIELEEAIANPEAETSPVAAVESPQPAPPSRLPWVALAILVPLAAVVAWWVGSRVEPPPPAPDRRFELFADQEVDDLALSPDGSHLAYKVGNAVFIRSLDLLESRTVVDDDNEVREMFWSPDSRSLGMTRADDSVQRFDLDRNATMTVATLGGFRGAGPTWAEDGFIYFSSFQRGIERVSESGGALEPALPTDEGMVDYHGFVVLPQGRGFLTLPHLADEESRSIYHEQTGEEKRQIYESDSMLGGLTYSDTGHLLFHRQEAPSGLWALPFSLERLEATGPPFLVIPDLDRVTVSTSGDLVYARSFVGRNNQKQEIVWADRGGEVVERLGLDLFEPRDLAISPDGSRAALIARGVGRPSQGKFDVWVIDIERESSTKLTEGGVESGVVAWSADGSKVAFFDEQKGADGADRIVAVRADGTGDREMILEADISFFADLSRDWSIAALMHGRVNDENGMDIFSQRLDDPSSLAPVANRKNQEILPLIHPSGRWLAYSAGDFVTMETFIQPFPSGEGRWKASVGNGMLLGWSPDGRHLYYDGAPQAEKSRWVMEVPFDGSGAVPAIGKPTELFRQQLLGGVTPTADGRFVFFSEQELPEGQEPPDTKGVIFVENWFRGHPD